MLKWLETFWKAVAGLKKGARGLESAVKRSKATWRGDGPPLFQAPHARPSVIVFAQHACQGAK